MSNAETQAAFVASDLELAHLDKMLRNIDADISVAMSYVRRAQGLTFEQLEKRMSGMNGDTLKRYMQQSYPSMRPLHFVAAYSWIMMVPMTCFYYGLKIRELYRGMDESAVEALLSIGQLPSNQFKIVIDIIFNLLDGKTKDDFCQLREEIEIESHDDYNTLFPPQVLDISSFAIDYYRSVAITTKKFRLEHDISLDDFARVIGLSSYQCSVLEDINKPTSFSVSIGARVKLGFKLNTHVNFTSEMRLYPEFHRLRQAQHVRDRLIVEGLSLLKPYQKRHVINIIMELSIMSRKTMN